MSTNMIIYICLAVLAVLVLFLIIRTAMLSRRLHKLSDLIIGEHHKLDRIIGSPHSAEPYPTPSLHYANESPSSRPMPAANPGMTSLIPETPAEEVERFFTAGQIELEENASKRGKNKPMIPFGENKKEQERRDSYAQEAVDGDYSLDSIDFSRVEGYAMRNIPTSEPTHYDRPAY